MPANGNTRLMTWKKSKTMESKVTFKVSWDNDPEKKSGLCVRQISCGDAEDIPVPVYMAILKALMEAEYILNGDESPKEEAEPVRIRGPVEPSDLPPPPTPKTVVTTDKMRKAYTEEEKNEIAQLYQDGLQVNEIARRFGRKPESIYTLVSSMGVKRNQKREYEKPEVIAASDASDQPKAKRECTLKKPWYLQPQTPNNRTKAKHE